MVDRTIEILDGRLYFAIGNPSICKKLQNTKSTFYFTIDNELVYKPYFNDFGPLNISCVYKFCVKLKKYLDVQRRKKVVLLTSFHPKKKVNAAFLLGAFTIIFFKLSPLEAYNLIKFGEPYKEFVDALQRTSPQTISLYNCLQAIERAISFNFFDINDFDAEEYDLYDRLRYGNINWIIPRKFLAFLGPADSKIMIAHKPAFYLPYFIQNDVKTVIRLNSRLYDASVFTNAGIDHYDLFFHDGTVPSKEIIVKFLRISETAPAAIAVHCKAGLGRTGTLIACYLIKHYHMTAREAIGWLRLCRPGSVVGIQQSWLEEVEDGLRRVGRDYRLRHYKNEDNLPQHKYGIYSHQWHMERKIIVEEAKKKLQEIKRNNKKILPPTERAYFKSISKLLTSIKHLTLDDRRVIPKNSKVAIVNESEESINEI